MLNGTFACFSRSATAGSRTRPSSMPRKITLLVVGMRLNTGAEFVGGRSTGVGVGCFGGAAVGGVGGPVVVVVVVVVAVVVVVGAAAVAVVEGGATSSRTALIDAAACGD